MIKEIPKQIANLKQLEILDLGVNAIRALPKEMAILQNLKSLNLDDNPGISDIDVVTTLGNLEKLTLFGCNLNKLPADIGQLKKLKYLGLTGNNLSNAELKRIKKALPTCEIIFMRH